MNTTFAALRAATEVVFIGLGLIALAEWRRQRGSAGGWLAASFGTLGVVVLVARFLPETEAMGAALWLTKGVIVGVVLFPYFLWRLQLSLRPAGRRARLAAGAGTAFVCAWALVLPAVPAAGQQRSPQYEAFVLVLLVQWAILSGATAYRLWKGGAGQPSVARRRMRTMAIGSVWLTVAIVVSGTAPSGESVNLSRILSQVISLVSGPFFLFGFAPPAVIRGSWRRKEEMLLRIAEEQLMTAASPSDVGLVLLPHVSRLLGGGRAELFDRQGNLIASEPGTAASGSWVGDPVTVALSFGELRVLPSPFAPLFGQDETELMRNLALLADLALARADLFEQLRRSNAELEQFAYVASHDLQEPLRTVSSYADLIARRYDGQLDEKADRHIGFITDGCARMQQLINDLLQLSRLGTQPNTMVVTDLDVPLDRAIADLALGLSETSAVIRREDLPMAEIDVSQLTLVFQNLIANAIKFRAEAPPEITIDARTHGSEIIIRVCDNGIGIDPKYQDRIFTIFQRLHTRSEYPGTGIGLAVCKKIVERHGGRIWLDNETHHGASFLFSLPQARSAT